MSALIGPALADEHMRAVGRFPQLAQTGDFIAVKRVRGILRFLNALDVEGLGSGCRSRTATIPPSSPRWTATHDDTAAGGAQRRAA